MRTKKGKNIRSQEAILIKNVICLFFQITVLAYGFILRENPQLLCLIKQLF